MDEAVPSWRPDSTGVATPSVSAMSHAARVHTASTTDRPSGSPIASTSATDEPRVGAAAAARRSDHGYRGADGISTGPRPDTTVFDERALLPVALDQLAEEEEVAFGRVEEAEP